MDSTRVSEAPNPGSIPGEATIDLILSPGLLSPGEATIDLILSPGLLSPGEATIIDMIYIRHKIKNMLTLFGAILLIYALIRLVFIFVISKNAGQQVTLLDYTNYLWLGLRFDLSGMLMLNSLFLVGYFFPYNISENKLLKIFFFSLFIITNTFGFLVSCVDIVYFPFVQKRVQSETFLYLTGKKGDDASTLIPIFLKENILIIFFYLLLVVVFIRITWAQLKNKLVFNASPRKYLAHIGVYLLVLAFTILGIRGGLQMKPLDIIYAAQVVPAAQAHYVLNTPFSIFKSMDKKTLQPVKFFNDTAFVECDLPIQYPMVNRSFVKKNVVIIIVEGLSKNYLSYYNGTSKTPFLDSLFTESMVFSNGFANAKESIQGIPAVVASIPSWQDDPYIFSNYAGNNISSIASLLKPKGYQSYFFHGGGKGTMGFDGFASAAQFDQYIAREDYPNQSEYDGSWGIWDEPFLQFMATTLNKETKPFVSVVFTLNTHHPFEIPSKYRDRFKQNGHPINRSVQYADYSLAMFFKEIQQSSWFNNTLFVITADHTGPNTKERLTNNTDHQIPIVFYAPGTNLKGLRQDPASQIDIMPTILNYLNYNEPYFTFGKSLLLEACNRFSINYNSGVFHCYSKQYYYQFNGEQGIGFYDIQNDPLCKNNLLKKDMYNSVISEHDEYLKKKIQIFNTSLMGNKMTYANFFTKSNFKKIIPLSTN